MKPGYLVILNEGNASASDHFIVGNTNKNGSGFKVPNGSIALVLKIEMNPSHNDPDDYHAHVLVNGIVGWVYPEDGEVINEAG
jgi:hypothetical protein